MIRFCLILILLSLLSCVDTNLKQTSNDIDDAKNKGVFKQEYKALINPIIENDSVKIEVKSAWIESGWYYDDRFGRTIRPNEDLYLRINLKDTLPNYYGVNWLIIYNLDDFIRSAGCTAMISTLGKYKTGDTLVYYLRKGYPTLYDSTFRYNTPQKITFVPVLQGE